jgi:uncharacterized membrane protein YphA (DoxX/SURF4 family)
MDSSKIAFLLILCFFTIVFVQSGLDKILDKKRNLNYLNSLLKPFFSSLLIRFAFHSVTTLELASGLFCLAGLVEYFFYSSSFFGLIGLVVGSLALLVLLFGQRVSKNYDGAKTLAVYFILAMAGIVLS